MSKSNDKNKKISFLIFLLPILIISVSALLVFKLIKDNKVVSNALVEHLKELASKKQGNPIFIILFRNNASLIRNIENSYIYKNIEIGLICCVVMSFSIVLLSSLYLVYQNYYKPKIENINKEEQLENNKYDLKLNGILLGACFFGILACLFTAIKIPFLLKTPDKLADLLCKAIEGNNLHNNAAIEIFKKIIHNTFHEEKLIINFKEVTTKYLIIFTSVSAALFALLLISGGIYYYRNYIKDFTNDNDNKLSTNAHSVSNINGNESTAEIS